MKNLLIYIHPNKSFKGDYYNELEVLVKVQIDNSLTFGWKAEDILLVTNFPYGYHGVMAKVLPDSTFDPKKRTVSKINAIVALFEMGVITDELVWFHDFDAFQNAPLGDVVLGDKKLALTHTSVNDERFSTGAMFFSKEAKDIFVRIQKLCQEKEINEERAIMLLPKDMMNEFLVLDLSHNFAIRKRDVSAQYEAAEKPIKVLHFHPFDKRPCSKEVSKNPLEVATPLMGDIFRKTFEIYAT